MNRGREVDVGDPFSSEGRGEGGEGAREGVGDRDGPRRRVSPKSRRDLCPPGTIFEKVSKFFCSPPTPITTPQTVVE